MTNPAVIDDFRGNYFFLSNFYPSPITATFYETDYLFATGEHLFQGAKVFSSGWTLKEKQTWLQSLTTDPNPSKAKYHGRSILLDVRRWNAMSLNVMKRTQQLKYEQNPELQRQLLDTKDAVLIEGNTWGDKLWGQVNGEGQNLLGKILMDLRTSLRYAS